MIVDCYRYPNRACVWQLEKSDGFCLYCILHQSQIHRAFSLSRMKLSVLRLSGFDSIDARHSTGFGATTWTASDTFNKAFVSAPVRCDWRKALDEGQSPPGKGGEGERKRGKKRWKQRKIQRSKDTHQLILLHEKQKTATMNTNCYQKRIWLISLLLANTFNFASSLLPQCRALVQFRRGRPHQQRS